MAQAIKDPQSHVGDLNVDAPQMDHNDTQDHERNHEQKDRDLEPSSPTADNDEKPSEIDSDSYHEVERNIGVTKIEALYIVFGKGWKLAMLWLYVPFPSVGPYVADTIYRSLLLIYYVFSLGSNTIWNCMFCFTS
jgi:hypothetical protein